MFKSLTGKYLAVTGIALVLWISAGFVRSLGDERKQRQQSVIAELSSILTPEQEVGVPFVRLPYVQISRDEKGKEVSRTNGDLAYWPAKARFTGKIVVSERRRGIFRAQAYELELKGSSEFEIPPLEELVPTDLAQNVSGREIRFLTPYLVLPISQRKALQSNPVLTLDGGKTPIAGKACPSGFCYDAGLTLQNFRTKLKAVTVAIQVIGLEQFKFSTGSVSTQLDLESNWPSPSFSGDFLPSSRTISDQGFTANWNVFRNSGEMASFQIRFVDPVDVYTLIDRAAKHSILFILCVFIGFFAVEVFRRIKLHTIQYTLVGASLVVFYLLVLSLSEHVSFAAAYLASVAVSVSLIRFYLGGVLRNALDANLFAGALVSLYGLLFVILYAEDFALLLGSTLIFSLLGTVMVMTRKMDWFRIEQEFSQGGNEVSSGASQK